MELALKCICTVARYLADWSALPHRVDRIVNNDLPHVKQAIEENATQIQSVQSKLDRQIGFCEGRQQSGPRKHGG